MDHIEVVIVGRAGAGKTTLADAIEPIARDLGWAVEHVNPLVGGNGTPRALRKGPTLVIHEVRRPEPEE